MSDSQAELRQEVRRLVMVLYIGSINKIYEVHPNLIYTSKTVYGSA